MKKFLLSLVAAAVAISASAFGPITKGANSWRMNGNAPAIEEAAASRATGYQLRFCGSIYTWYNLGSNVTSFDAFVPVSAEMATQLAGNKLNRITLSACLQSASTLPGSVFVMEEDENGNLVKVTEQKANIRNSYGSPLPYQNVNITTPYEIKAGKAFYFGYSVSNIAYTGQQNSTDFPLGIDDDPATSFAGYVATYNSNGDLIEYLDAAQAFGANLFIYAQTVGDVTEMNDVVSIGNLGGGNFTLPVMPQSADPKLNVTIQNIGDNAISSVEYVYGFNGGEKSEPAQVDVNIPAHSSANVSLPASDIPSGPNTIDVAIVKANTTACNTQVSTSALILSGEGYPRKFVVEEATSVNCGYCPVGIVGMDYMAERYPNAFLGIAVHSNFNGSDPMQISGYLPWLNKYVNSFPSCMINRDPLYADQYPSSGELTNLYNVWRSQVSPVQIEFTGAKLDASTKTLTVSVKSTFQLDMDNANYGYFFTVLEDDVFGLQLNYYAGGNDAMGGWEKKPERVEWYYTDVPRAVEGLWGIEGSIPTSIATGEHYEYTATIDVRSVGNVEKMKIVAAVLDLPTGVMLNANEIAYTGDFENGITDAAAGKSVKVIGGKGAIAIEGEYNRLAVSTLSGIAMGRTTNLAPGIYVVNVDGRAFKVVVK